MGLLIPHNFASWFQSPIRFDAGRRLAHVCTVHTATRVVHSHCSKTAPLPPLPASPRHAPVSPHPPNQPCNFIHGFLPSIGTLDARNDLTYLAVTAKGGSPTLTEMSLAAHSAQSLFHFVLKPAAI
ncbi:hypothetical protein B0T17DRAFT_336453 [Bombardia bombarda]|uniref:Uncharacterized protein n=1 Tax=Bombardia bombarda TaxID=252184 RepID=A0AA40BYM1_9PEZI|nr:hypothetical protein B0T17DRAFT_336453 [Bombardia bombarda]